MAKEPHEKVREFIKANLSLKREALIAWLQGETDEWINVDVKVSSKSGKWYCQVNEWKKEGENKDWRDNVPEDIKSRQEIGESVGILSSQAGDNEIRIEDIPF